jgi:hypothetical protein
LGRGLAVSWAGFTGEQHQTPVRIAGHHPPHRTIGQPSQGAPVVAVQPVTVGRSARRIAMGGIELSGRRASDGLVQSFRTLFGSKWDDETPKSGALLRRMADTSSCTPVVHFAPARSRDGRKCARPPQRARLPPLRHRALVAHGPTSLRGLAARGADDDAASQSGYDGNVLGMTIARW